MQTVANNEQKSHGIEKTYINTYINTKHVAICCSQVFDAKTHIPCIKYHLGTAAARSRICLETNGAPQRVARSPKWYYGCDQKSSGFLWKTMRKTLKKTMENHTKNHPMKRFPLDDLSGFPWFFNEWNHGIGWNWNQGQLSKVESLHPRKAALLCFQENWRRFGIRFLIIGCWMLDVVG